MNGILGQVPAAALLALVVAPSAEFEDARLASVLDRARAAAGTAAFVELEGAVVVEGPARPWGTDGKHTLTYTAQGAFHEAQTGRLAGSVVSDGVRVWTRYQGAASTESVFVEREMALLMNWVRSGFWLCEEANLERALTSDASGEMTIDLMFPGEVSRARVTLDPETYLVATLSIDVAKSPATVSYSDYREVFGMLLPHSVFSEQASGVESEFTVERVSLLSRATEFGQDLLGRGVADATFDTELTPVVDTRRITTGHTGVRVTSAGAEVGWFLFDSGAGASVITPEAARALSLERIGTGPLAGWGPEARSTPLYLCESLEIGPMTISNVALIELDMHGTWPSLPKDIQGIIGWDILARSICEVDSEARTLKLFPASRDYDAPFEPLILYGNVPHSWARFEGAREGVFALDTGAPWMGVHFSASVVRRWALLDDRRSQSGSFVGAGGLTRFESGVLDWFEFGGRRFEQPSAQFSTDPIDDADDPRVLGVVGGAILDPFVIVFDYPRGRLALVERAAELKKD